MYTEGVGGNFDVEVDLRVQTGDSEELGLTAGKPTYGRRSEVSDKRSVPNR